MQDAPHSVDRPGSVAGQQLERHECRAAARGTFVLEPALQQLELLPVAKLPDRPVRDGADAEVGIARRAFDLVIPLAAQIRNRALVTRLGELLGMRCRLGEIQRAEATGY